MQQGTNAATDPAASEPLLREELEQYRAELIARHQQIAQSIQQVQAQGNNLVGHLNQAAGELKALNRLLGRPEGDVT